jgi:CNT family concentrative nucleoside transporter
LRGVLGLLVCGALAFLCSEDRRATRWRPVLAGFLLQAVLAVLLIRLPASQAALRLIDRGANAFQAATDAGDAVVFGYLGGAPAPFAVTGPGSVYILAFRGLPLVLTISAFSAVLYYWGVLQRVLGGLAWLLRRVTGIGGPLALGAAVHVFVGMTEAPLLIRPYLARMQRGELFALMTCGMAGVAGTVMLIYASLLGSVIGNALGNILIASVVSTPAAIAIAALMVPFDPDQGDPGRLVMENRPLGALDALVRGAMDGVPVLVGIVVMLIVAIAAVSLVNASLGLLPAVFGAKVTLQAIAAVAFRPLLWTLGVPWRETAPAALLMATKTVLNEFVAYLNLAATPAATFAPRTRLILTYAMCGFANFGSVGILVGGLGAMVPSSRRHEVVSLGARSLVSGTLATCMSGAWAGLLSP